MAVLPVGIGPVTGYTIDRSLRFNSADSAYLNRTPASDGNRTKWTWSGWVKRGQLSSGTIQNIFGTNNSNRVSFSADENITIENYNGAGADYYIASTAVYRDLSAWYHIVAVWDSGNATAANRQILYVNGQQVTAFSSGNSIPLNATSLINSATVHNIGRSTLSAQYFSGYLTEINFIDGQALTPSSFGETNTQTGVWQPKAYSGTYGTNGFYLKFADNTGVTATTLGKDSSGNGNNWTPNNFSVTAGADNDSLVDTPTPYGTDSGLGGQVGGNYTTLNPLDKSSSGVTLTNGNLDSSLSLQNTYAGVRGTFGLTSGKWYFETTHTGSFAGFPSVVGLCAGGISLSSDLSSNSNAWLISPLQGVTYNGSSSSYGSTVTTTNTVGIAVDMDSAKIWFAVNGTWIASGNPAAGTNARYSNLSGTLFPVHWILQATGTAANSWNFGQRPFAYTAPSGFKALVTTNLPTPTIGATSTTQAGKYFNAVLYTGTGSSLSVTGVGFQPDLVWYKSRDSGTYNHGLFDAVRGTTKFLASNLGSTESTVSGVTAFNSDGFTVGSDAGGNSNNASMVAWCWKANGAGSSNTVGSITSTVSANTTSGFSIVAYTGNGSTSTVGHGLGVAPKLIILKSRTTTAWDWNTYSSFITSGYVVYLNDSRGEYSDPNAFTTTAPTSTVFSLGTSAQSNNNTTTYIAYCFAEIAGFSRIGSYVGNGSTDGPFVYCGFRPAYILIKSITSSNYWMIKDKLRANNYNVQNGNLYANATFAEDTINTVDMDFLSNGIKLRGTYSGINSSSTTYIYLAFAEFPFKYSLAR